MLAGRRGNKATREEKKKDLNLIEHGELLFGNQATTSISNFQL